MSSSHTRSLGSALALFAGVGCATAIVEEEPDALGSDDGTAATSATSATGGTAVAASGGGTTSSKGGTTSTGGTSGTSPLGGSAGRANTMGGAGASAGGPGAVATCPTPLMPAQPGAAQGNSGSFDTTEGACYFVEGTFNTWNCSNIAGRSVTINGMPSMCGGSLPAKIDGGYYFEFGAASDGTNYTSFYWYTS